MRRRRRRRQTAHDRGFFVRHQDQTGRLCDRVGRRDGHRKPAAGPRRPGRRRLKLTAATNSLAIARAIRLIKAHDAAVTVTLRPSGASDEILAIVEVKTELPSEWRAAGRSPSGVRTIE